MTKMLKETAHTRGVLRAAWSPLAKHEHGKRFIPPHPIPVPRCHGAMNPGGLEVPSGSGLSTVREEGLWREHPLSNTSFSHSANVPRRWFSTLLGIEQPSDRVEPSRPSPSSLAEREIFSPEGVVTNRALPRPPDPQCVSYGSLSRPHLGSLTLMLEISSCPPSLARSDVLGQEARVVQRCYDLLPVSIPQPATQGIGSVPMATSNSEQDGSLIFSVTSLEAAGTPVPFYLLPKSEYLPSQLILKDRPRSESEMLVKYLGSATCFTSDRVRNTAAFGSGWLGHEGAFVARYSLFSCPLFVASDTHSHAYSFANPLLPTIFFRFLTLFHHAREDRHARGGAVLCDYRTVLLFGWHSDSIQPDHDCPEGKEGDETLAFSSVVRPFPFVTVFVVSCYTVILSQFPLEVENVLSRPKRNPAVNILGPASYITSYMTTSTAQIYTCARTWSIATLSNRPWIFKGVLVAAHASGLVAFGAGIWHTAHMWDAWILAAVTGFADYLGSIQEKRFDFLYDDANSLMKLAVAIQSSTICICEILTVISLYVVLEFGQFRATSTGFRAYVSNLAKVFAVKSLIVCVFAIFAGSLFFLLDRATYVFATLFYGMSLVYAISVFTALNYRESYRENERRAMDETPRPDSSFTLSLHLQSGKNSTPDRELNEAPSQPGNSNNRSDEDLRRWAFTALRLSDVWFRVPVFSHALLTLGARSAFRLDQQSPSLCNISSTPIYLVNIRAQYAYIRLKNQLLPRRTKPSIPDSDAPRRGIRSLSPKHGTTGVRPCGSKNALGGDSSLQMCPDSGGGARPLGGTPRKEDSKVSSGSDTFQSGRPRILPVHPRGLATVPLTGCLVQARGNPVTLYAIFSEQPFECRTVYTQSTRLFQRLTPNVSGGGYVFAVDPSHPLAVAQEQHDSRPAWELRTQNKKTGAAAIRSMLGADLDFDGPPSSASPLHRPSTSEPLAEASRVNTGGEGESPSASGMDHINSQTEPEGESHGSDVEVPEAEELGRGQRQKKFTARFKDFIPHGKPPLGLASLAAPPPDPRTVGQADGSASAENTNELSNGQPTPPPSTVAISEPPILPVRETNADVFGVYKRYQTKEEIPHDPDAYLSLADLQDEPVEELFSSLQVEEPHLTDLASATSAATSSTLPIPGATAENSVPTTVDAATAMNPETTASLLMTTSSTSSIYPYPNPSCFALGEWYWGDDSEKTMKSFQKLISIVGSKDFRPEDVRDASWTAINRKLGASQFEQRDSTEFPWRDDGTSWTKSSVTIDVPFNTRSNTAGSQPYTINEFRYRPLVPLIREKLQSAESQQHFHFIPHELRWRAGPNKEDVRVHCELYQSDAFLEAYEEVQSLPREGPDDDLPRCVVGLMFASDATMLAHFGDAKLWPLYMFYANDSKYRRSKTSLYLGEQVAYFEKLPDEFKDWALGISGQPSLSRSTLTHCQRELLHAQLRVVLDDEFMYAYEHGIVIQCADGVKRRFYPRILTYSADYCKPGGLTYSLYTAWDSETADIRLARVLGMVSDRKNRSRLARVDDESRRDAVVKAREWIYQSNYSVTNERVVNLLKDLSLVPTRNAFSERLSPYGFNLFDMLTSDVMHEVELGVWKSLFIQLLRLLEALPSKPTNILDSRFRRVPTFGKDIIRRFRNNTSEMKQLAARDYEDMLPECSIPVFEGLFEDKKHNKLIASLLFVLAHWHGLAKLRTHTDQTLQILDDRTTDVGSAFRAFLKEVCQKVDTKELKREADARKRREVTRAQKTARGKGRPAARSSKAKSHPTKRATGSLAKNPKKQQGKPASRGGDKAISDEDLPSSAKRRKLDHDATASEEVGEGAQSNARKSKTFSLHTYKFHALGHVVTNIRRFGTSDNYSTQGPESYHRSPKSQYRRTSKRRVTLTLSRIQTRQARIRRLRKQLLVDAAEGPADPLLQAPYFIGQSQNKPVDLAAFLILHRYNPATKVWSYDRPPGSDVLHAHSLFELQKFFAKLKAHLLPRIREALLGEARADPQTYAYALPVLEELVDEDLSTAANLLDRDRVFIDKDRLYRHEILNVHFTSYEGRRERDILNPNTSRREFMCLREDCDASPKAPILLRTSFGKTRRFDVLWVRWFEELEDEKEWADGQLDRVGFYPLEDQTAFDFLDPTHVLHACHLIPRFSLGQVQGREPGYSPLTKAHDDWVEYMVNRFVDRDMLMRYHWGLGIGHLYSHEDAPDAVRAPSSESEEDDADTEQSDGLGQDMSSEEDSDGSQYTLQDREDELAGGEELDGSDDEDDEIPEPDEEN
ncbi:hypothetical protein NMY22_g8020 [Coprinellus aureogranulatus]|nr:hypothetical protein NMY22_g8020 [Coprinellus aureogranulatus]